VVFERALRRELSQSSIGIFVALFAIMATTQLVRLLNDAVGGRVAPEAVAALLGFTALQYLPTLLSLTLFIAILMVLSRMYRDSEMVIWLASGCSLHSLVRPVLRFALPVAVVVAALSFFFTPWAATKSVEYRQKISQRSEATLMAPGSFREASGADRVVFVEKVDENSGEVRGVFVRAVEQGKLILVSAERGRKTVAENGDRFLVLDAGRRYEITPGSPETRMVEFARYSVRIELREKFVQSLAPRQLPPQELLQRPGPAERAELVWRLSLPLSAAFLALMAIPLSYVNNRGGKSFGIVMALLVFLTYNNILSVFQSWVAQERISAGIAWWLPHSIVGLLFLWMMWRRSSVRRIRLFRS
jgi:lipopolysaccharide export system permease protein